jgi:hypothetical protein
VSRLSYKTAGQSRFFPIQDRRLGASEVVQNGSMTDRGAPGRPRPRVTPALLGTLAAATAWVLLVLVAVDFGGRGRDGDALGWVVLVLAGLGAAVSLAVALFFGRQLLVATGVVREYEPKRARR